MLLCQKSIKERSKIYYELALLNIAFLSLLPRLSDVLLEETNESKTWGLVRWIAFKTEACNCYDSHYMRRWESPRKTWCTANQRELGNHRGFGEPPSAFELFFTRMRKHFLQVGRASSTREDSSQRPRFHRRRHPWEPNSWVKKSSSVLGFFLTPILHTVKLPMRFLWCPGDLIHPSTATRAGSEAP